MNDITILIFRKQHTSQKRQATGKV